MAPRLPDFLIIGAQRSGTTSLARWLDAHPAVFIPEQKELHVFDRPERGLDVFDRAFAPAAAGAVVGEATPAYMYEADAVTRMAREVPGARLIAILRNPVDRAWSHYWWVRARDIETLEFPDAIDAEAERIDSDNVHERRWFSYLDRGRYAAQLERLDAVWTGPPVCVLIAEEAFADPPLAYRTVCEHIGVDGSHVPKAVGERFRSAPQGKDRKSRWERAPKFRRREAPDYEYPPMPADVRADLVERFRAGNAKLAERLGRELPWDR